MLIRKARGNFKPVNIPMFLRIKSRDSLLLTTNTLHTRRYYFSGSKLSAKIVADLLLEKSEPSSEM